MRVLGKWAATVLIVAAVVLIFARQFLWIRSSSGEALHAGQSLPTARIYTNSRGSVLVLPGLPASGAYVINPRDKAIGIPMHGFWLKSKFAIGLKQDSIQWIQEQMKNSYPPRLRLSGSSADFTDFEGRAIHVGW